MTDPLSRENTGLSRGIAIGCIMLCHLCAALLPVQLARLTTPLGGIGVAAFLFLSGYGVNESFRARGLSGYWGRKLRTVLLPYAAAFAVYALILAKELTAADILGLFLTVQDRPDCYFWYVGYQFLWYLCFYAGARLPLKGKYALMLLTAAAGFLLLDELRAEQSLSFVLGAAVSDFPALKRRLLDRKAFLTALVLGVGMLLVKQLPLVRQSPAPVFKSVQLLIKLPLGLCLVQLGAAAARLPRLKKVPAFAGRYAYEIYLAHALAMPVLLYSANRWLGLAAFAVLTALGITTLAWLRKAGKRPL